MRQVDPIERDIELALKPRAGACDIDRDETVVMLLARMDDDPFAFFHGLEKEVVEAFDTNGPATFRRRIRSRFETVPTVTPAPEALPGDRPEYWRHHWGAVLRAVCLVQKDGSAYVALTGETGLSPEDCFAMAKLDECATMKAYVRAEACAQE